VPPGRIRSLGRLPGGHVRTVEREVLGRTDGRLQLQQRPILQLDAKPRPRERRPEATERHQLRARRDGGDRVDLQQGQMPHHIKQLRRLRTVEQLRAYRDAARIGAESSWTVTFRG